MSRITAGWLARHTPQGPGGRQAALIDIAQDLLLTRLHQRGVSGHLVFKGGTALRKLYTGNAGRFSTDLDFSVRNPAGNPETVAELLPGEIDGQDIDGFRYSVDDHRGRPQVRYQTPFGGVGNLSTKLDIGPAPWLPPVERGWVRLAVHAAYELPPGIPVMALEGKYGRKVARLTPPHASARRLRPHLDRLQQPALGIRARNRTATGCTEELGRSIRPVIPAGDMAASYRRRPVQHGRASDGRHVLSVGCWRSSVRVAITLCWPAFQLGGNSARRR